MSLFIQKTDAAIQREVLDELQWDTRVSQTDVGVEVSGGVVTLTGAVESWAARLAAQEAAHRVSGVLDVANDLEVKPSGSHARSDTEIAKAVRTALESDVFVPHLRIRTTVANGVVTLEGDVDFWSQHDDAARCVRNLLGVREVKNLVVVDPSANPVSPHAVRTAIERALERRAGHAAKHIQVGIVEGKVILAGEVASRGERSAVEGAVRGTRGVSKVDNRLRIQPSTRA